MERTNTAFSVLNAEDDEFLTPLLGASTGFSEQAGVIRPGIMVLKKTAAANDQDKEIYKRLYSEGKRFDEIDKTLGAGPDNKSKLTPKNVDYFTVRPDDCVNPDHAKMIMEYADEDGKLRSLPVWFPINDWWELIPHSLKCYGETAGLRHRSNFIPERDESNRIADMKMVCESPEACVPGRKLFGGRSWTQKECNPEMCELYQREECKLRGSIQCMIPGIPGIGTWSIPTTSFYSLNSVKSTLKKVHTATNGRIANIKNGDKETIFRLRKRLTTIPTIDVKTGQPKLRDQYLIVLEVNVDLWELSNNYVKDRILTRGELAADKLNNEKVIYLDKKESPRLNEKKQDGAEEENPTPPALAQQTVPETNEEEPVEKEPAVSETSGASSKGKKEVSEGQLDCIKKLCNKYGIPAELVEQELKKLDTFDNAAGLIRELNKGDISRFIPKR